MAFYSTLIFAKIVAMNYIVFVMVFRLVVAVIFMILFGFEFFLFWRHRKRWGARPWFRKFAFAYWLLAAPGLAMILGWILFGRELFTWPVDGALLPLHYLQTAWNYTHFILWPFYFSAFFLLNGVLFLIRKIHPTEKAHELTKQQTEAEGEVVSRSGFLKQSLGASLLTALDVAPTGLALVSFGGMFLGSREIVVDRVQIRLADLPENFRGMKLVQISDIHIGNLIHDRYLSAAASIIKTLKADALVVTGDIIDNNNYFLPVAGRFFRSLESAFPEGRYGILGNHDFIMDGEEASREFSAAGLKMLRNETIRLKRGRQQLNLTGLDFPPVRRASLKARMDISHEYYRKAIASATEDAPVIVLNHHPSDFEYLKEKRADLVLSGHTHGGQFMFSSNRESPLALASNWYRYYIGHYSENGRQLYVNRGLGHWFPLRIACPPEITLIELV